jgi:hypothetical protein
VKSQQHFWKRLLKDWKLVLLMASPMFAVAMWFGISHGYQDIGLFGVAVALGTLHIAEMAILSVRKFREWRRGVRPQPRVPTLGKSGGLVHPTYFPLPVAEAKRLIHDPEITHKKGKVLAALSLAESFEHDPQVTFDDMLRCLDYGGTIAEAGARCLYVRTGRDGLGWANAGSNGLPYVVDRADWEKYLRENHLADSVK